MKDTTLDFLTWYFSGSDQEKQAVLISLGQRIKDDLLERGEFFISTDQLAMECWDVYQDELKSRL